MKAEHILENIEDQSSIDVLPAKNVQIKKILTIKDIQELKSRLPFLKKAVMTEGKIMFETQKVPTGLRIK